MRVFCTALGMTAHRENGMSDGVGVTEQQKRRAKTLRLVSLLAFTLIQIVACREPLNAPPSGGPSLSTSVPPSAGAACEEGRTTCNDETTKSVCRAGKETLETCAEGSVCLARSCVKLVLPDDAQLSRDRVRTLGKDGWLNGWSAVTPLSKKAVDGFLQSLDPTVIGGPKAFRPVCARDGFVVPRARGVDKDDGQIVSVASAALLSDQPRRAHLWASVSGKLRVFVATKEVLTIDEMHGIDKRPLVDEHVAEIDLAEGSTHLTVVLEAPADPIRVGGFYLRLRELDGSPMRGVAVAERFEPCSSTSLLDPGAVLGINASGFFLQLDPVYRGLTPRAAKPWPVSVEIIGAGRSVATEKVEGLTATSITTPEHGGFELKARLAEQGSTEVLFARTIPAYGSIVGRVAKLLAAVDASRSSASCPPGSRDSFELSVRALVRLLTSGDSDTAYIERKLKIAERHAERIARGEDPYAGETGVVERAYRSALDGKLQPYIAFIPKSQDKGKPQPLVLIYHGRDRLPAHALRTLIGEAPDDHMTLRFAERNLPGFPDQGALLVAPYGYDEGGPHPLGEDDLLRVVAEMSAAYKVDPRRVSLTGYSLGGTVAFVAPLHHPDVFSGAAPLCGYPNLLGYSSVSGVAHAPWEDALLAKKYIVNYAENGAYLPLNVVHGGKDGPGRSKVVVDRYKSLGYSYIFDVQDDLDHDVWDYAYEDGKMVAWLEGRKRPASPKAVRFVTSEYRYDKSYWVRLIGMKDSASAPPASIDAKLDEKSGRIEVKTVDVTALALDRDLLEPKARWAEALTIAIDGDELPVSPGSGPIFLERADHWAKVEAEPARSGMKRHGVSGPIDDVLRHAVVVVYGTQVAAHVEANRSVGEHMGHAGGIADIDYPVLADTDATEDALRGKSLILVGSPAENLVTAKLASGLPIKFEPNAFVVHDRRFEGDTVGVSFIAPRPDATNEYVVVHAGLGEAGTLASRYLPRYLPDFVVYDGRIAVERGGLLFGQRPYLDGGFFSEHWD